MVQNQGLVVRKRKRGGMKEQRENNQMLSGTDTFTPKNKNFSQDNDTHLKYRKIKYKV